MRMAPHPRGEWEVEDGRGPKSFWHALDWWSAGTTTLAALVVYLVTLAPGVTLEDSGELVTAAWGFGVPHPPGYPVWTLVAWIWVHIFPVGNIAWRANLLSAVFAAMAVGLTALLVSRSGRVLAAKLISHEESFQQRLPLRAAALGGLAAGLLLAFSPAFWSQAVIAEVYTMNVCIWMAILVGLYRWSFNPEQRWRLYLVALLWGVGLGVHQTSILAALALAFFVWLVDRSMGRDLLVMVLGVIVVTVGAMVARKGSLIYQGFFSLVTLGGLGLGAGIWLYFLCRAGAGLMRQWRSVLIICAMVLLGLAFYLYEPLASATNPPMNWGYTQTLEGFLQHFTRTQYAPVQTERTLLQLWAQLNVFLYNLQGQFNIVFAVLGLALWFFFRDLTRFSRDWQWFLLVAFLSFGLGFIFLSNPPYEKLRTLTDRVFFLPAYCVYAVWIGYSLILLQVFLLRRRVDVNPWAELWILTTLVFPVVSLLLHGTDSTQRNHTFGYGYGYRMFKPEGAYPEMERDAVLFGGTDAGRFVPTYMVFVESQESPSVRTHLPKYRESLIFDRRDVYVLSQDTLADPMYLHYLHDQYGAKRSSALGGWQRLLKRDVLYPRGPLWLPSQSDWREALQRCLTELGRPSTDVVAERGNLRINSSAILNAFNGTLSRMVFEQNKERHPFYVEEGDVLPWMYPYLEPYGLIMRLHRQPVGLLDPSIVGRDRRYWDEQSRALLADKDFLHDAVARLVFSKARAAIGGLYAYHRMTEDAEYAFRQALELYPDNEEATRRFALFYVQVDRFKEAQQVLADALLRDTYNLPVRDVLSQVKEMERIAAAVRQLEAQHVAQPSDIPVTLQLLAGYARRQRVDAMDAVVTDLLSQPHVSAADLLQVADFYAGINRLDRATRLLRVSVQRFPNDAGAWYGFAAASSMRGNCLDSVNALARAFALDPSRGGLRDTARKDPRLDRCRHDPLFQQTLGTL